ncbi:hypothetical protein RRG08_002682 [Elysia crispata]|uniref:Uncharacterized protein n=1 Tax=Elysia crispata TaxID=231223 RepID=A0AAE0XTQ9_9GAST|nr:hypothetical protein RRG08_002682 [Elysia crispata]
MEIRSLLEVHVQNLPTVVVYVTSHVCPSINHWPTRLCPDCTSYILPEFTKSHLPGVTVVQNSPNHIFPVLQWSRVHQVTSSRCYSCPEFTKSHLPGVTVVQSSPSHIFPVLQLSRVHQVTSSRCYSGPEFTKSHLPDVVQGAPCYISPMIQLSKTSLDSFWCSCLTKSNICPEFDARIFLDLLFPCTGLGSVSLSLRDGSLSQDPDTDPCLTHHICVCGLSQGVRITAALMWVVTRVCRHCSSNVGCQKGLASLQL